MNCRECTDFLYDYLAGDLPEQQLRVFEAHLELCPPCLTYLETYRATCDLGKAACAELPEPLPEALVNAILTARKS